MAVPANTFQTYSNSDNIAEEVDGLIRNTDPHETPFFNGVKHGKTSTTYPEWLTDVLNPPGDNKKIEGDDATTAASSKATRVGNYTQISDKVIGVAGTNEATNRFGRTSEKAYQMMKDAKELKTDMEYALVGIENARVAGGAATARELASVQSWISTNANFGATGAAPTGDGTDVGTAGTPRAFTEDLLKDTLQTCWEAGAKVNTAMTGAFNRGVFSGFSGNADAVQHMNGDKRIVATAKVYDGDFHTITVVPNRIVRSSDVLLLQMDTWEILFLRPFKTEALAKTGDSHREQLIVEYTLKAKNEKANAIIRDLTTS